MATVISIVDQESGEVVHALRTERTGRALDKLLDGMYLRVDLDRFFIRTSDDDGAPQEG